jgi:hypothetical protein
MKNLLNLNGAQQLSKAEQKEVNGGWDSGFCARFCAGAPDPSDWRYQVCFC